MRKDFLNFRCGYCKKVAKVPVNKIYDGFDGEFTCNLCGGSLDTLHEILDDE